MVRREGATGMSRLVLMGQQWTRDGTSSALEWFPLWAIKHHTTHSTGQAIALLFHARISAKKQSRCAPPHSPLVSRRTKNRQSCCSGVQHCHRALTVPRPYAGHDARCDLYRPAVQSSGLDPQGTYFIYFPSMRAFRRSKDCMLARNP